MRLKLFVRYLEYRLRKLFKLIKYFARLPSIQICLGLCIGIIMAYFTAALGVLISIIFMLLGRKTFALFAVCVCVGVGYFGWWSSGVNYTGMHKVIPGPTGVVRAEIVSTAIQRKFHEEYVVKTKEYKLQLIVKVPQYSNLMVGDVVDFGLDKAEVSDVSQNYTSYLLSKGIGGIFSSDDFKVMENTNSIYRIGNQIRESITKIINSHLLPPQSDLLSGILVGDRAEFSPEFKSDLQDAGLMHIVAVSGYNVMLVVGMLGAMTIFVNRKVSWGASLVIMWIFLAVVGLDNLPALRAVIMTSMMIIAHFRGRNLSVTLSLIYASTLMMIINPLVWRNISWQLSFGAMWGLVLFAQILQPRIQHRFGVIAENLSSTLAVMLVTVPISFLSFGSTSLVGIMSNLTVVPLVPMITWSGFAALLTNFIPGIGSMLWELTSVLLEGTTRLVSWWGDIHWGIGDGRELIIFLVVVGLSLLLMDVAKFHKLAKLNMLKYGYVEI